MVAAATTGCRTDEKPPEGLPLTEDTIPDRPQALVSLEAEQKVVNPKTALLYRYLPNPNVGATYRYLSYLSLAAPTFQYLAAVVRSAQQW